MIRSFKLTLFIIFLAFGPKVWSKDLYIAVNGNDKNPGTITQPLASFEAAKNKVRTLSGKVTVFVRGGTYYLQSPIVFSEKDARKSNEPVIYTNYPGEEVIISGGEKIHPKWETYQGKILKARMDRELIFDQLFVNEDLQRMARYPNYDSKSSHFGGYSKDVLSPQKIAGWKNPRGAFIHALHKHEWGGYHYQVTGKDENGGLKLKGGYQNNRQMGMHDEYRFVENIREELDDPGEWFFDRQEKVLYLIPKSGQNIETATLVVPQIRHLFEFRGSESSPVRNITLQGLEFRHVLRTFMETKEPLLRSDWAIYRGGTILLEGTENCHIRNCHFNEVGGNGVFFSNYNRKSEVYGCHMENIGGSGVCFVGDPTAVRSPLFEYNQSQNYDQIDLKPGPKNNSYPAECKVYNNLMHDLGRVEKQVAGVQLSMSMDILVSHNTIYNVPRSGINVSEGTWGGHIIEFNDVYNTVLETGDHGAFNSWGRDRFWHPNREEMDRLAGAHPELILLDAQKTTIIRNNRFRCDHGWDIDLDDGSSNYHIYNNVCLNGGLKLREGFQRIVENNIMINNSFHPHVWFEKSGDVFRKNIVLRPYYPIRVNDWGKEVDYNLFPDDTALKEAQKFKIDAHSRVGNPLFENPSKGDYRVKRESPALKLGFVNFPMDQFGVVSPELKKKVAPVSLPLINLGEAKEVTKEMNWLGGSLRNIQGLGDRSAYGLPDEEGVLVQEIQVGSILSKSSLKKGDVIRKMNNKVIQNLTDFSTVYQEINWMGKTELEIMRNQKLVTMIVGFK